MSYEIPIQNTAAQRFALLGLTVFYLRMLVTLLVVIDQTSQEFTSLDFLAPYKRFISMAVVAVFGWLALSSGSRWIYRAVLRWASADTAAAMRITFRIVGGGVLLSTLVSTLTGSATAALTIGSFAGLVVGFATQTVMGNAVSGLFLLLLRPVRIGDRVTVSGYTGEILTITLMHVVIRTDEQDVLLPTSSVVNSVIALHREHTEVT